MVFVKGQSGNPAGKPKGTKNRDTLLKEERRAVFEQEVSQMWRETIRKMKPEYLGDQFMGKAPDKIEVKVEDTRELSPEEVAILAELAKKKKLES